MKREELKSLIKEQARKVLTENAEELKVEKSIESSLSRFTDNVRELIDLSDEIAQYDKKETKPITSGIKSLGSDVDKLLKRSQTMITIARRREFDLYKKHSGE
jgi:hypothetical protein